MVFPRFIRIVVCILSFVAVSGCSEKTGTSLTEQDIKQRMHKIHDRLGFSGEMAHQEITHSVDYTKDQAADLKLRVAELVVAYEKLFNDADCEGKKNSKICAYLWTSSAGLRYNVTILDAEHSGLPHLPPRVYGKR
jgi:hypothetical protein